MKRLFTFFVTITMFLGSFYAVNRSQDIIDWWRLRNYTPVATIEAIAESTYFSEYGQKLFYVHDPQLLDRKSFQTSCTVGEATIVLGCYVSKQRIFLYDVNDPRLDGIEEVTAAHEMLHAAYDRLHLNERKMVDELTKEAYERFATDRVRKSIASYSQESEDIVRNEMHSILATELEELPKDLEVYYSRYFTNRRAVVELANSYAQEFENRENQIKTFDNELSVLNGEIARLQAELSDKEADLLKRRTALDSLRGDPAAYNERVNEYNDRVNDYNSDIAKVKSYVDQYNSLVKERNEIAVEERELVDAIDTRAEQL